ncbi:type IV toxin-antitoxin system AbiEi family antitoxin domain-containing protein [Mesorhizobium silamurunense]|nr:type IV toxin-antitoxin system AbiEi family antitoxin domain-containing protein [Mesorhizobium silamurunense]
MRYARDLSAIKRIELGRGKRQIVVGGRLESKYQITVPETLDAGV